MADEGWRKPDEEASAERENADDTALSPLNASHGEDPDGAAQRGGPPAEVADEGAGALAQPRCSGDREADADRRIRDPLAPDYDNDQGYRDGPRIYGSAPTNTPTRRFKIPGAAPTDAEPVRECVPEPGPVPAPAGPPSTGGRHDDLPPFPWAAFGALFTDLFDFVWARSWGFRLAAALLLLSPVAAAVGWWQWREYKESHYAQLLREEKLLAGPKAEEKTYPSLGTLKAAERVMVLEELETYALVRDALGRVGYLARANLTWRRLAVRPDAPFVGCVRAPVAPDATQCENRGRSQLAACLDFCSDLAEPSVCQTDCEQRLATCLAGCAQPAPETSSRTGSNTESEQPTASAAANAEPVH